jgi:hypothetical protein
MATSTLSAALAAASNATRATPQGGILEGENPTIYDMKDPVIIFIIQVSFTCSPAADGQDRYNVD